MQLFVLAGQIRGEWLHSQLMSYNPLEQVMRTLAQKQLLWQGEIMEETTLI